ncbi:50S ribosomal protein L29 [Candidatus Shapirobacteria bacterium CG03_land_8_20_14_0_80_40_19]|uniref:Large ribosomal subunit protein uL29 n=4 Tax=Candidatus Shapironibacteriota TaxID=1752721 RepID=A0A2M7BE02_9BACT|nr:MAG: 50S ribosomal protein L29 [Candidatus Shapirobacteria bacterium CG11_big_fil_rev_8_21_14_0_20_40_12]PIV01323.1 MAG: 50S ribosomal protein L29 [Candidatus Shapirobacteria bacterium CG03_land_8_20_14_0_80_40_19]PJC29199.1 MAG: 50S ribosomal protein L29 [Candidatus Shapirobacteria bacterium CG_4_9_14_0_2_um_filter_40_11]PJC76658.1 MAG: 50S ribosomal protein L29 [Candidatus Shapirobacteria bacterium CG_4_8_14_3_um_filter_39_11]
MKKKIKEELRNKSVPELEKEISGKEEELARGKMDLRVGKVKNTSAFRFMSDYLAVAKTILKEKQLKDI